MQYLFTDFPKLTQKGVIEETKHVQDDLSLECFLERRKMGLNLNVFNNDVVYRKLKMDTLQTVLQLVQQNSYMATIDIRDAYLSVSVAAAHHKYLRFIWRGRLFQFVALPNGLKSAPRQFTQLMKSVSWHIFVKKGLHYPFTLIFLPRYLLHIM